MKQYVINQFEVPVTDAQDKKISELLDECLVCKLEERDQKHQHYLEYIHTLYIRAMYKGRAKRIDRTYTVHQDEKGRFYDPIRV